MRNSVQSFMAIASVISIVSGCSRTPYQPTRPANVSVGATYIQGPEGNGLWEGCDALDGQDQCHIWSVSGNDLQVALFIPYDGGAAVPGVDLKIAQQGGAGVILLKNGRYLIPAQGHSHEAAIRYLDFVTGKTNSFAGKKDNH